MARASERPEVIQAFYRTIVFTNLLQIHTASVPLTGLGGGTTLPAPHEKPLARLLARPVGRLLQPPRPGRPEVPGRSTSHPRRGQEAASRDGQGHRFAGSQGRGGEPPEGPRKTRQSHAAYQTSVEKAAIDADPAAATVIEKTRRLQQEALARRNTAVNSIPRQAPRVAAPSQVGQPIAAARPSTGFPRPSELFDNWAAVGLLIALGVIAVLLLRKRG